MKSKFIIALAACSLAMSGCGGGADSGDVVDNETMADELSNFTDEVSETKPEESKIADGTYVFKKSTDEGCEQGKVCVGLQEYQSMCNKVSGMTEGLGKNWGLLGKGTGNEAFSQLLEGGTLEGVRATWMGPKSWTSDSGIEGACSVAITVSGIYNGSSARETGETYVDEFVVSSGEVLAHHGQISAISLGY